MMLRTTISPGVPTPIRPVPGSIVRPEYVGRPRPAKSTDSWVQTDEIVDRMRVAAKLAARALAAAGAAVAPGVTTDALDGIVHEYLSDHAAYPSTLGYRGYPKSCCTSLNEVICHGIPDSTVIDDGDTESALTVICVRLGRPAQNTPPPGRRSLTGHRFTYGAISEVGRYYWFHA